MDRTIEKKKGLRPKHIAYIVGVSLFLFLIIKISLSSHTSTFKVERDKISIETVKEGEFNDYIRVIGKVEPITTIFLDAIEGGRVEEKLIEEGSIVKKGDVILRLSNSNLNLSILNSEAHLAEQTNNLRNTLIRMEQEKIAVKTEILQLDMTIQRQKRAYEQNEVLIKDELIPKEDYLRSKEDYLYSVDLKKLKMEKQRQDSLYRSVHIAQMEFALANMQKNLKMVHERVENLKVKAPVDGQLGMLDAEIGQLIGNGTRIGQINVLTDYKIEADIDEHHIDRVQHNLEASFDRQDEDYSLRVRKVYPEVREGQFKIDMVFTSDKPDNIRTGQTYHIKLQLGQPQHAMMIPRGGFFQSTGGQWVYVLDPSGEFAIKRNIKIGKQNPQYYEIIEGLNPGEQVITSSYDTFGENDKLILR
ncbi:HlyD family efflux transporter periplasmic adaptor subunit [Puteibacter caeruleilacunae]|nr:HlyD family efflux transporter periplasmic adaptor subunit [Puteibacter caeruleilacunae]